jgi:3'5'-cyclic nucleotide phosphodiesterase
MAVMALRLTEQPWTTIGMSNHPDLIAPTDIDTIVDRLASLLLVRIVAVQPYTIMAYPDLSTSTICRTAIKKNFDWPDTITSTVVAQLRAFVHTMVSGYKQVPYHNREHAYHVTVSTNKLVDMLLHQPSDKETPKTFGLRRDAIAQLSLVFAALVHDVEHEGVPNRQLAAEGTSWAIQFNDQSIAENRSLFIAFSELLSDDYVDLRRAMFADDEAFKRFRKYVIGLILTTDLASSERMQVNKSKWKEAFGDPFETVERKVRRRASLELANAKLEEAAKLDRQRTTITVSIAGDGDRTATTEDDEVSLSDTPDSSVADPNELNHCNNTTTTSNCGMSVGSFITCTTSTSQMKKTRFKDQVAILPVSVEFVNCKKFQRRMSSGAKIPDGLHINEFRRRLGIRRSIDLSGDVLDNYAQAPGGDLDAPDELKASVVMEVIITAADVAHNLQGWDNMKKWSTCLYHELMKAHDEKRGFNPSKLWFENQLCFLESYLLPLARKLEDTGVYGKRLGPLFAEIVEANRDRWITEGWEVTNNMVAAYGK